MVDIVHYHRFTCMYRLNEIKFLFHSMMGKVTYRLGVSVWRDINQRIWDPSDRFYILYILHTVLYSRAVWYPPPCWWGPVTRPDTASTCPTSTALMSHRCTSETGLYLFLMTKGILESKNCTSRSTMVVWLKMSFSEWSVTFTWFSIMLD